jgi:riboflavin kinase/FMN adenylyltransferase
MSSPDTCVVIGIFDGVHRGHQELLKLAATHGRVIALTFFPHPTSVFAPERTPTQLVPMEDRVELLMAAGADEVVALEFNAQFAAMSPDEFIDEILIGKLKATHVIIGENFTFGHKASGNAKYLAESNKGFGVTIIPLQEDRGSPVSSTRIRHLITDGEVERAAELLTRDHYLKGPVVHGEKRGREIGYPTANIGLTALSTIPADGIYAGWLTVEGKSWQSAISIGTNPTFPGIRGRQVEAYALDQTGLDLYDKVAKIEFVARLRDTLKFEGLEPLLVQMAQDCLDAKKILELHAQN